MTLEMTDVAAKINDVPILDGVSLTVEPHQIVALLGRNGMGKTTTMKTIMGLTVQTRGSLVCDGRSLGAMPSYKRRQLGIVFVPEDGGVFQSLSVEENLKIGTQGRPLEVLEPFPELRPLWRKKAGLLSGGERKILAFGRAWLSGGRWFLIDEPSLGLSPAVVRRIEGAILSLKALGGVLLVEQNIRLARATAQRYLFMERGRIVENGTMDTFLESTMVRHGVVEANHGR